MKKKRSSEFRVSQLGIRVKVYELPGTQCLVQASQLSVRAYVYDYPVLGI